MATAAVCEAMSGQTKRAVNRLRNSGECPFSAQTIQDCRAVLARYGIVCRGCPANHRGTQKKPDTRSARMPEDSREPRQPTEKATA